jgi:hypothetical protein
MAKPKKKSSKQGRQKSVKGGSVSETVNGLLQLHKYQGTLLNKLRRETKSI